MKVAFVVPFFGERAAGGAESECRNIALRLAASGVQVEVLTTCLLDLQHDWNINYYRQDVTDDHGVWIRRFRIEPVNLDPFNPINTDLINGKKIPYDKEKQFIAMHVNSSDLYRYIANHRDAYDWICFIPYLFGTTYYGSMFCSEKAVLIPCLHDEGYARMEIISELFHRVKKIIFNTTAERELAHQIFGSAASKGLVLGVGVETKFESNGDRFKSKFALTDEFVLYAGRKDKTKNAHLLIHYFTNYRRKHHGNLKLVMIGPDALHIPQDMRDTIIDLGFISEQDKKDVFSAASFLCQPSLNESFSIVMMESWLCGTPCLIHGECEVTRNHVVQSGGGLYFTNYGEFAKCLDYLQKHPDKRRSMEQAGKRYVLSNYNWNTVIKKYKEEAFEIK